MKRVGNRKEGLASVHRLPAGEHVPADSLTTTTICGTDVHILKGEYPVEKGLTIGHEPVGIIEKLGSGVEGFAEGQRVIAGAITPRGTSNACFCGQCSQDGVATKHGFKAMGGWRFGNTIDGSQAEYLLVPDAGANMAVVPDNLTDEQVLMCPDILSAMVTHELSLDKITDAYELFANQRDGVLKVAIKPG